MDHGNNNVLAWGKKTKQHGIGFIPLSLFFSKIMVKNMNKKIRIFLTGFFLFTFIGQVMIFLYLSETNSDLNQGMSIRGARIIIFTTDGYSESDLQGVKIFLDRWRGTVTIAGLSETLTTTGGSIISDVLISDIDEITTYNAIFIPGGELVTALIKDNHVIQLLETADDEGLVIAGIDNGTLVQAAAGLILGKSFTTHSFIVDNLTDVGGIYVEEATVVTDGTIITASSPNYEELAYTIANTLGYSYKLDTDISFEKEEQGWNYSITVESSDKHIVSSISMNLSIVETSDEKTLVESSELIEEKDGVYTTSLGILANGYYVVDIEAESIYGNIEVRTGITEFSVGSN